MTAVLQSKDGMNHEMYASRPSASRKSTRSLSCMKIETVVGSGTFGVVYRAMDKTVNNNGGNSTDSSVALKKIRMDRETQGFPVTALREIKVLNLMQHPNVISLREIITYNERDEECEPSLLDKGLSIGDVFMVFEFVDYDLAGLLKSSNFEVSNDLIKSYMHQLLAGCNYLHSQRILHRDIKSANLLITNRNILKIADLGLAKIVNSSMNRLTNPVVTLWYRSPELILGSKSYGPEVDMWSVGCILGELKTRVAMFRGDREITQLEHIFRLTGTPPTGDLLTSYKQYPDWEKFNLNKTISSELRQKMIPAFEDNSNNRGNVSNAGVVNQYSVLTYAQNAVNLLERLLDLNPSTRINAVDALNHPFFTSAGAVLPPEELPVITIEPVTEYLEQEKQKRRDQEAKVAAQALAAQQQQDKLQQQVLQQQQLEQAAKNKIDPTVRKAQQLKSMRERDRSEKQHLNKFTFIKPKKDGENPAPAAPNTNTTTSTSNNLPTNNVTNNNQGNNGHYHQPNHHQPHPHHRPPHHQQGYGGHPPPPLPPGQMPGYGQSQPPQQQHQQQQHSQYQHQQHHMPGHHYPYARPPPGPSSHPPPPQPPRTNNFVPITNNNVAPAAAQDGQSNKRQKVEMIALPPRAPPRGQRGSFPDKKH